MSIVRPSDHSSFRGEVAMGVGRERATASAGNAINGALTTLRFEREAHRLSAWMVKLSRVMEHQSRLLHPLRDRMGNIESYGASAVIESARALGTESPE